MAHAPNQQGQPMVDHKREPCPDRILNDIGGAFAMGAVGGGIWHLIKGTRNSPSGYRTRGAIEAVRREAPRLGGSFANWGLTFALFDCSLQYVRKKEDPWNAIGAGAMTGGFLQLRFGLGSAAKSAMFGGFLLALIEGLGIALTKLTSPPPPGLPMQPMGPGGPGGPGMGPGGPMPPPGMPGTPGMAMPGPDGAASSGGDGGGFFASLFGGSAPAPAPVQQVTDLSEDPFQPPPLPKEFAMHSDGGDGSFKHN
ncbi:hypothetical protein CHLRE_10g452650v5 [Chlamydomonas reinhardtii]|uniref:Uncharacterized protein n=1 Tax=Chlamydomonas reinhardtii TaxID=3055 RepID=A8I032_CHLRE|nr:uncharacterized protein CHLRE_10g452650v5 [Chlamydomonas reinhardtii]PNW77806.1 hypothetical protein CHLRE_10g452650v5 [Chlamydomonas reinhardtii]|eukprot:XP_001698342.1 mitochondrial inner membrane translocase [Chlamydomonas reinhardtii]